MHETANCGSNAFEGAGTDQFRPSRTSQGTAQRNRTAGRSAAPDAPAQAPAGMTGGVAASVGFFETSRRRSSRAIVSSQALESAEFRKEFLDGNQLHRRRTGGGAQYGDDAGRTGWVLRGPHAGRGARGRGA